MYMVLEISVLFFIGALGSNQPLHMPGIFFSLNYINYVHKEAHSLYVKTLVILSKVNL